MVAMTSQEIKTRVIDQLRWDDRVDASDIGVTIDDGLTRLTGTVNSYRSKLAAEADARAVSGTRKVDNQLEVQLPPTIAAPSDAEITSNVNNVLLWNPRIDSTKIDVSVVGGVVTLEGTVDSFWKKYEAENDAYWVVGVIAINNALAVVPSQRFSDEAIGKTIEDALDRSVNVNVNDVTVEVNGGIVTLRGIVPSWIAWRAAYDAAMYTTGVVDVVDRLAINE